MHAHELASHEIVLPTDQDDQNDSGKLADLAMDLGQLKIDQVKGSTKLTAGDVPNKEKVHKQMKFASEAAVHVWIWTNGQHADPTVDGMIVKESLKRESSPTESNSTIDGLKRESSFTESNPTINGMIN